MNRQRGTPQHQLQIRRMAKELVEQHRRRDEEREQIAHERRERGARELLLRARIQCLRDALERLLADEMPPGAVDSAMDVLAADRAQG